MKKHCKFCGSGDKELFNIMIRSSFSFGKNFPVEYEQVLLCKACCDMYEEKNKWAKVGAVIVLIIVFSFIGIKFFFLYSNIFFNGY